MSSPRRSYRARLLVVPTDSNAESMLRRAEHPTELVVVPLDDDTLPAVQESKADMLLLLCTAPAEVPGPLVNTVAIGSRQHGLLVAGAITGGVLGAEGGTEEERAGLAAFRQAVDMLVLVRDESLVIDLLDVLRGGRTGAPVSSDA